MVEMHMGIMLFILYYGTLVLSNSNYHLASLWTSASSDRVRYCQFFSRFCIWHAALGCRHMGKV